MIGELVGPARPQENLTPSSKIAILLDPSSKIASLLDGVKFS
jgi:hypothetical protein